jgi:hypothetical protein
MGKIKHFMYVPFTGLGLYQGMRGNRWLKNRIKIFKQFVVPSLLNQTNRNFTVWIGWRPQERDNKYVLELQEWLKGTGLDFVFTFGGLCFWDDKYEDLEARSRLATALHLSMRELINLLGDVDEVLMTIQPSDDCYRKDAVELIQAGLKGNYQAFGFAKGYISNYLTKEVSEYNPTTNPPFYTIRFPKEIFIEPQRHIAYAPIKSHEYVGDHLKYNAFSYRGFLVGTHGENVSTYFNHPFKGQEVEDIKGVLSEFGLQNVEPLRLPISIRKKIMAKLPYGWQRKLRYWVGEKFYHRVYNFLRN